MNETTFNEYQMQKLRTAQLRVGIVDVNDNRIVPTTPFSSLDTKVISHYQNKHQFILVDERQLDSNQPYFSQTFDALKKFELSNLGGAIIVKTQFCDGIDRYLSILEEYSQKKEPSSIDRSLFLGIQDHSPVTLSIDLADGSFEEFTKVELLKKEARTTPYVLLDDSFVQKLRSQLQKVSKESTKTLKDLDLISRSITPVNEYGLKFDFGDNTVYVLSSNNQTNVYAGFSNTHLKNQLRHRGVFSYLNDGTNNPDVARNILNSFFSLGFVDVDSEKIQSNINTLENVLLRKYGFFLKESGLSEKAEQFMSLKVGRMDRLSALTDIEKHHLLNFQTYKTYLSYGKDMSKVNSAQLVDKLFCSSIVKHGDILDRITREVGSLDFSKDFNLYQFQKEDLLGKKSIIAEELSQQKVEDVQKKYPSELVNEVMEVVLE